MKKTAKLIAVSFFSFAVICNNVKPVATTSWSDIDSVFNIFSQLGDELDKSTEFFSSRANQFNDMSKKMDDLNTIRNQITSCVTSSYEKLVGDISDCLQNYANEQTYYNGQISTLENDIKTLKELTDAEIANLKKEISDTQAKYDALLIQYNTLKGMNKEAVDAALAKLIAAQTKFETILQERQIFSSSLDTFLSKIYTEQGLSHLDLLALKELICK